MNRYDESGDLTSPAHKSDHAYIKELKDKAEKRQAMVEKVQASLITAFLWSILSGIGGIIWYAIERKSSE